MGKYDLVLQSATIELCDYRPAKWVYKQISVSLKRKSQIQLLVLETKYYE